MRRAPAFVIAAVFLALAATGAAAPAAAATATATGAGDLCPAAAAALEIRGSTLCLSMDDPRPAAEQRALEAWALRSGRIVADYYGQFPAPLVMLRIESASGGGVHGGRTTRESGLLIRVSVGRDVTPLELATDWVLVHEMVHLALPEVGNGHDWLAEGLATYVEGIARAQFGNRDIRDVWAEDRHSMRWRPFASPLLLARASAISPSADWRWAG